MSKGQNDMAKRVLLSTLNVGDKFTSDIKGGNFIITSKVGDRINIQDLDTGKETFFGSGSYMVEPISEEAPQQTYTFRQPEYMDDPEYGEKSAEEIYTESRIAKGYENLNAEERAKHLLSHPTSKYMSDLKSENITERAIRKAVKEMLAQPDKRDPQFITDVNEEGEAPAIANTTAEVANPDLPLKLKESVGQKLNITLIRKPQNLKEVESDMRAGHGDRVKAVVDKSYTLSKSEYEAFVYNFYRHTTYLSGEGGHNSDGTVSVIEIKAPGMKTIYVDPEGYDYAKYVGY